MNHVEQRQFEDLRRDVLGLRPILTSPDAGGYLTLFDEFVRECELALAHCVCDFLEEHSRYTGAMTAGNLLYIGIKGAVLALDRTTGAEVWSCKLKGSDFVNVAVVDGDLYAATKGELFCLDARTGATRWQNPLSGYGWGLISIAAAGGQTVVLREKQRLDEDAAAAAT
jgi:hypothetical protein